MNNTKIATSLDNTDSIRKAILDNPELPLVIFAGEESYCGEYSYNLAEVSKVVIEELTLDGDYYVEKSEYKDKITDRYCIEYETEEELKKAIDVIMKHTEFVKAIVMYVG